MKKNAIVTGASRGIGFAVALKLALNGYNIATLNRSGEEKNRENFDKIRAAGAEFLCVKGDISQKSDREALVCGVIGRFGEIHLLVNNAGVAPLVRTDLLDMSEESFDRVVGINTKGNLFLTQLVARQMLSQPLYGKKRGDIINISSCSAEVSSPSRGEYCVSKAGVAMLTKLFADRLAGDAIFVNEIRPGIIETDMTGAVKEKYDKMIAQGVFPIARWGSPEDVAGAVCALASDDFAYTTGSYLDVDGGFHIKRL